MRQDLAPSPDRVAADLDELATIGRVGDKGVSRLAFSAEDVAARDYIVRRLRDAELEVRVDAFGNIFGRRSGRSEHPIVMFGSHIDTTQIGGRFDGTVGVVGALEAMRILNDHHIMTDRPLEVVVFAAEESARFGVALLGSRATSGRLNKEQLLKLKDDDGITLWQALERVGLRPDLVETCAIPPDYAHAYLELHVEQGGVLESVGKSIGIVTAIAAPTRGVVTVRGQASHSGAMPMALRRDALTAAAEMVLALEELARSRFSNVVATVGRLEVLPGALNTIPGQVRFTVDVRSVDSTFKRRVVEAYRLIVDSIAKKRNVEVEMLVTADEEPIVMSDNVVQAVVSACREISIEPHFMPSGGAHDSQEAARYTDAGMIFVPSRNGISHSPDEFTSIEDIGLGVSVLAQTLVRLSGQNSGLQQ